MKTEITTEAARYVVQSHTGRDYYITEQQHDRLMLDSSTGKINGCWIQGDYLAFSQIKSITEIVEPARDYPQLPAVGMDGMLNRISSKEVREKLVKNWQATVERRKAAGEPYKNIQGMIDFVNRSGRKGKAHAKYKTFEEAKAAGVVFK